AMLDRAWEHAPGRRLGMSPIRGGKAPTSAGAERRTRWPPCGKARPSSGREQPAHNADRRAYRRLTAAFSFVLGTAFWKRTGAPIRTPLIPRGFPRFHPLHQPVAGRTHVVGPGGVSRGPRRPGWLGRTLRRRIPPRSHAPHENALGRVGRWYEITSKRTNQEHTR